MIVRQARADDRPAIIETLRAAFGSWHDGASDAYWDWKFDQNPHGRAHIWVGDDGGAIAGCYIWNPVRLRLGATTMHGAQSVDAAVHPDYQGRGLFTDLARAAIEDPDSDFDLVYAFPTEGAFRGQIRVGFENRFPVPKTYRPLLSGRTWRRPDPGLSFVDVMQFDSRFDVFSANDGSDDISVARDSAYLQWRHADHPAGAHETIACERDGELRAYCVLSADRERRVPRGHIVDFQALPTAADDARRLLAEALRRLRARGSRVAVTWFRPPGVEQGVLAAARFSPAYGAAVHRVRRQGYVDRFIVLEPGAAGVAEGGQPVGWSLVPGDADYV